MSLGKEIQRAQAKIEELQAAAGEFKSKIEAVEQERNLAQKQVEEMAKTHESAMAAAKSEHEARVAELQKTLDAANTAAKELQAKHAALKAELDDAKSKLANPAFGHAAAKGEPAAVVDAGQAADANPPSLHDQYAAIEDPVARSKFWIDHEKELRAEGAKLIGK